MFTILYYIVGNLPRPDII